MSCLTKTTSCKGKSAWCCHARQKSFLLQVWTGIAAELGVMGCACAGTVAALYRALAAAAGLPPAERPEERLLIVEAAMHRVTRRLVRPWQQSLHTCHARQRTESAPGTV